MTRRALVLVAGGGSAALLLAVFGFQYLGGLAPCKLCIWQRWPHGVALLVGAIALVRPGRLWPALGGLAALATAALGLYHTGVERGWWQGPTSCTGGGGGVTGMSGSELLSPGSAPPVVMCDEVVWQVAGLSMASWNALLSLALAGIWAWTLTRSRGAI